MSQNFRILGFDELNPEEACEFLAGAGAHLKRLYKRIADLEERAEKAEALLLKADGLREKAEAENKNLEGFVADCVAFLRGSEKAEAQDLLKTLFDYKHVWTYQASADRAALKEQAND